MNPLNNNTQPQNPKEQALNLLKQQGKDLSYVMELIDELMTVLQTVQPRLYSGVMSHL